MGKHISGGFQKKASDMPSFGATFFATGGNLRSSVKPSEKPKESKTEAPEPEAPEED